MKTPVDMAYEAQYVKRWSMLSTTADSTVASHSFNVAILAMAIHRKMMNTIPISIYELCYYAVLHDIEEVYTGDIPTPTKVKMRELGFDPNEMSDCPCPEVQPTGMIRDIIKIADLIDNWFWIKNNGTGGRSFAVANEVHGRLLVAMAGAGADLRAGAQKVIQYIQGRTSNEEGERKRFAQDRERRVSTDRHFRSAIPCIVD